MLTVYSSHGELTVDTQSGKVTAVECCHCAECIDNIVRFDLDEYKSYYGISEVPNDLDILDLAGWTDKGERFEAEGGWRKDMNPRNEQEALEAEKRSFRDLMEAIMKRKYGLEPNDYDLDNELDRLFQCSKNGQTVEELCYEIGDKLDLEIIE